MAALLPACSRLSGCKASVQQTGVRALPRRVAERASSCAEAQQPLQSPTTAAPDVTLQAANGCSIDVFGVEHLEPQNYIGEYILQRRPSDVMVETALTPEHGERTGNLAPLDPRSPHFFHRTFSSIAVQLRDHPQPWTSPLWQALKSNFVGEQLAYIAAYAAGARLIFGDRPKQETYVRLDTMPCLRDLDTAFGLQSAVNYAELVTGKAVDVSEFGSSTMVDQLVLTEREAVMCRCLHDHVNQLSPPSLIVAVIGQDHIKGLHHLWTTDTWRPIIQSATDHNTKAVPQFWAPMHRPQPISGAENQSEQSISGVRRALLMAALRLRCPQSVLNDVSANLPALPECVEEDFAWTQELYGHTRMLLAVLSREQLAEVCCGWRCNMWDILKPLRDVRPVNGGPGYDLSVIAALREFDLAIE